MDSSVLISKAWYKTIEGLCTHLHDDQFPARLVQALGQITPLHHAIILAFPSQGRPLPIYNNLPPAMVADNLDAYLDGAYLIDPFYDYCINTQKPGIFRMREAVPDLADSEYFQEYYAQTGLRDEIGIFIKVDDEFDVGISLEVFETDPALGDEDMKRLRLVEPMVLALCHQHWQSLRLKSLFDETQIDQSRAFGRHLQQAFMNFGRDHLSTRECEVVRLIIKGHSSKSLARVLDISPDTVKVHRKRLHTKLQINSQAELFSLFLDAIARVPLDCDEDPLTFYFAQHPLKEPY